MKAVIQRVGRASLSAEGRTVAETGRGLAVYFCVEKDDKPQFADRFVKKITNLRIFPDGEGKMNFSVKDIGGEILFVSQFTLAADLSRGNRPGFSAAERPDKAERIYLYTADKLRAEGLTVGTGIFGADMTVCQQNEGPVTVIWEERL